MESINLAELSGYQEDAETLSKFQRPYLAPSLLSMGIALLGFLLFISEMEATHYYLGQTPGFLQELWFHVEGLLKPTGASPLLRACLPGILFFGGVIAGFLTMFAMSRATPISCVSGQRMEKYWNATPDRPGDREIVYVDRSSRTYFRRVFASTSGTR